MRLSQVYRAGLIAFTSLLPVTGGPAASAQADLPQGVRNIDRSIAPEVEKAEAASIGASSITLPSVTW